MAPKIHGHGINPLDDSGTTPLKQTPPPGVTGKPATTDPGPAVPAGACRSNIKPVALLIDLAEAGYDSAAKALTSKDGKEKLAEAALKAFAKSHPEFGTGPDGRVIFVVDQGDKAAREFVSDALNPVGKEFSESAPVKLLKRELDEAIACLKTTPVGSFVDKNSTVLAIGGLVLVAGGLTVAYVHESDATFAAVETANQLSKQFLDRPLLSYELGKLQIKAGGFNAQGTFNFGMDTFHITPSKSTWEVKTFAATQWTIAKNLDLKMRLDLVTNQDVLKKPSDVSAAVKTEAVYRLGKVGDGTAKITGSAAYDSRNQYELQLKFGWESERGLKIDLGVKAQREQNRPDSQTIFTTATWFF